MKSPALKRLPILAACALLGGTVGANASPYLVTLDEVGGNVVATGSGNIDLTGLTLFFPSGTTTGSARIIPPVAEIQVGGPPGPPTGPSNEDVFSGNISGPTNFGSGSSLSPYADSSGGNLAAISNRGDPLHQLPTSVSVFPGYVSDSPLGTSTATWDNATFASLGVTPGTYKWTWGTGLPDQSFTLSIVTPRATPLPAALPLFATGLGGLGLLGWRRKRKARAGMT